MTEEELAEAFRQQTKSAFDCGKLSKDSYEQLQIMILDTLDELERAYVQYVDMLTHPEYYKLLERIVRGATYLERTDITVEEKKKGMVLYDGLVEQARAYTERHRE